jgi:branched-chain amino acid transport system ATP-binding protein
MGILEIRHVVKRFGGLVAVNDVSIDIQEREIYSVIGPNGAGKTTLFNCITCFYKADEGEILLEGEPIHFLTPDRVAQKGIARTYQNIRLFSNMTVLENIMVGRHIHTHYGYVDALFRSPRKKKEEEKTLEKSLELLKFVGLKGKGDLFAKNLPYGEQRRLEIARALALEPKVLLLDEPTAGMNPRETEETMEFISNLRSELGLTILLIEHDMKVVMGISDRITVMDFGKVIAEGLPEEIRNNPRVIEAYLGQGAAAEIGM